MYEPNKKLGQNFLTNPRIADLMVSELGIADGDTVIEIGAGLGVLTERLARQMDFRHFNGYAVEIDQRFTQKLQIMFTLYPKMLVVEADILKWLPTFTTEGVIRILGSLPYYITSPIIHAIIKMGKMPEKVVILIQKEVAEKIASNAPDASYMSSFVQTFYDVNFVSEVSKKLFEPVPEVDGGILTLTKRDRTYPEGFVTKYEGFLHRAFSSPRKMLNKPFKKEELEKGGINPNLRPQNLTADEWFAFYNVLTGTAL
jgi:16S rRNA (adenine1518-N6/adenine1519-N6)-dimethyltransferase